MKQGFFISHRFHSRHTSISPHFHRLTLLKQIGGKGYVFRIGMVLVAGYYRGGRQSLFHSKLNLWIGGANARKNKKISEKTNGVMKNDWGWKFNFLIPETKTNPAWIDLFRSWRWDIRIFSPNGSGKSTTQKILTGILQGYGGNVRLFGKALGSEQKNFREKIGVLFEISISLHEFKRTRQSALFCFILSCRQPARHKRTVGLLEFKKDFLKKPCIFCSKGCGAC